MPRYLISHPGKAREDILAEDPSLTLTFVEGWAVFTDDAGVCLAIPADPGTTIQRIDDEPEPALTKG